MRAGLLVLLSASLAHAASDKDLLARIDAVAHETHTLSAELTQKSKVKLFKQVLTQTGRLAFEAPRRIRWEYLTPDPSVLVLDGTKATMSSPGAAPQVFDLAKDATMSAVFDQLLTFVGGGSIAAAESAYAIATSGSDRAPIVTLVPRAGQPADKVFARIELSFDGSLVVKQIVLVEKSGDEKTITFAKIVRNAPIPDSMFKP